MHARRTRRPTPLATRSDRELVALVRAGETGALAEIDRRYRSVMLSLARPLIAGTGYEPEDVVQDALVRAARSLSRDDRDIALRPWLAAIVRNRALDLRRRRDSTVAGLPDDVPSHDADPANEAVRRDDALRALRALSALPGRERAALVGRIIDGASHAELARRLDASVPAVKSLLVRARHRLATAA